MDQISSLLVFSCQGNSIMQLKWGVVDRYLSVLWLNWIGKEQILKAVTVFYENIDSSVAMNSTLPAHVFGRFLQCFECKRWTRSRHSLFGVTIEIFADLWHRRFYHSRHAWHASCCLFLKRALVWELGTYLICKCFFEPFATSEALSLASWFEIQAILWRKTAVKNDFTESEPPKLSSQRAMAVDEWGCLSGLSRVDGFQDLVWQFWFVLTCKIIQSLEYFASTTRWLEIEFDQWTSMSPLSRNYLEFISVVKTKILDGWE